MSMPPSEHLQIRDRMPGTVWRAVRPLMLTIIVVLVMFVLFSVGVAIATNDKCGSAHLNTNNKEWNYFPPRWDCTSTLPGQG
jgi:hypothetical protein